MFFGRLTPFLQLLWRFIKNCMKTLAYDLHLHSCLSPCGDNDMTPANIAGMAKIIGLDLIALTDHNSCKTALLSLSLLGNMGFCFCQGWNWLPLRKFMSCVILHRWMRQWILIDMYQTICQTLQINRCFLEISWFITNRIRSAVQNSDYWSLPQIFPLMPFMIW